MPHRNSDIMELIRKKSSMSAEISKTDPEYSEYSGGSLEISSMIAKVNFALEAKIIPDKYRPFLELYKRFLVKQRKAFFASVGSTEITKLGFIQGDPRKWIDANEHTE